MKAFVLLFSFLVLGACSNGGGGGGNKAIPGSDLPELTETQKNRMVAVSTESQGISSTLEKHSPESPNTNSNPGINFGRMAGESDSISVQKFESDMDYAMSYGDCTTEVISSKTNSNGSGSFEDAGTFDFGFTIKNAKNSNACPIVYSSSTSATTTQGQSDISVSVDVKEDFKISPDSVLFYEMDVLSYSNTVKTKTVMTPNQGNNSMKMSMTLGVDGLIISRSEGDIRANADIKMGGDISFNENTGASKTAMNITMTMRVEFPDFKAVGHSRLKMNISSNSSGEMSQSISGNYYINGNEVSEEEFSELFDFAASAVTEGSESDMGF